MYFILQREPFSTNTAEREFLRKDLDNYLIDPRSVFIDQGTKDVTKAEFNLNSDEELAQERLKKDISVLNFFFDTPIITKIRLEMRVSMFDKLSAIGGTLGLYTGISIITMIETLWWLVQFVIHAFTRNRTKIGHNLVHNIQKN